MAGRKSMKRSMRKRNKRTKHTMRKRRQYGGWQVLNSTPASVDDSSMSSASALSQAQGKQYDQMHAGQKGGAYSLAASAPVGYTGVLDDSLRASARVGVLDSSFNQIQGMSDQSGGRRHRRGKKSRKGTKKSRKGSKKSRRHRQGGGGVMNTIKSALGMGPPPLKDLSGNPVPVSTTNAVSKPADATTTPVATAPAPPLGGGMRFFRNLKAMFGSRKGRKGRKGRKQRGGAGYQVGPSQSYDSPGMLLPPAMENKALMGMNPEWGLAKDPSSFAPQ